MIFFYKPHKVHVTKEKDKKVILLGDFDVGLIKTPLKIKASESFDIIHAANLLSHSISPTTFIRKFHTPIDSITSNSITDKCIW